MRRTSTAFMTLVLGLAVIFTSLATRRASAHCDTMDGPVVKDAMLALDKGDVTPALKWVTKDAEPEIRAAFAKTLAVRSKGADARELADRYFFETLVRVHRAGEGAPFTGIKPAGTDPGAAVKASDKALDAGSPDALVKIITDKVTAEVRSRFVRVAEAKKHSGESVQAGREFVRAYVEFVHHAERLYSDAAGEAGHDDVTERSVAEGTHHAPK